MPAFQSSGTAELPGSSSQPIGCLDHDSRTTLKLLACISGRMTT